MEIKQLNTEEVVNSTPITCNPKVLSKIVDYQLSSYRENKTNLSQNLIEELEDCFGEANKNLKLEFNTKLWILEYNGLVFNVFSAKGKGTSIEIHGSYDVAFNKTKDIIGFLEELYKKVNSL